MNIPDWITGKESAPAFRLRMDKEDITARIAPRLLSLKLTDNRGYEADQLDIVLDDSDGKLLLPRRGVVLEVALGWSELVLYDKGKFIIDEIEYTGAPDKLSLKARSADFRQTLNIKREASYHSTTLGDIVKTIAARHDLKAVLTNEIATVAIEHVDQTNESDGSFLTRIARQEGAIAMVKNGNLLFIKQGQGKNASGKPLPVLIIKRASGDQHRFSLADRAAYTGVSAHWLNTLEPGNKETVKVKRKREETSPSKTKNPEKNQGDYLIGTDSNVLVLSHTYPSKADAERAVKSAWGKLQRGAAAFSIQLARGRADLYPEMPVKVTGFKAEIDDVEWLISKATHSLSDSGFTTSLEFEMKIDDLNME